LIHFYKRKIFISNGRDGQVFLTYDTGWCEEI